MKPEEISEKLLYEKLKDPTFEICFTHLIEIDVNEILFKFDLLPTKIHLYTSNHKGIGVGYEDYRKSLHFHLSGRYVCRTIWHQIKEHQLQNKIEEIYLNTIKISKLPEAKIVQFALIKIKEEKL